MKNQLLNLKMIALVCLMMVLGGGECMGTESSNFVLRNIWKYYKYPRL